MHLEFCSCFKNGAQFTLFCIHYTFFCSKIMLIFVSALNRCGKPQIRLNENLAKNVRLSNDEIKKMSMFRNTHIGVPTFRYQRNNSGIHSATSPFIHLIEPSKTHPRMEKIACPIKVAKYMRIRNGNAQFTDSILRSRIKSNINPVLIHSVYWSLLTFFFDFLSCTFFAFSLFYLFLYKFVCAQRPRSTDKKKRQTLRMLAHQPEVYHMFGLFGSITTRN